MNATKRSTTARGSSMAVLAALTVACASSGPSGPAGPGLSWSVGSGVLRLERVVQLRADAEGAGLFGWLSGNRHDFLFQRPYGVAWDKSDLLVADSGASRVFRLGQGKLTATPEKLLSEPIGVAACAAGIVVTDSRAGKVLLLDADLRRGRTLAEGLERPTGVACAGDHVVIAETGAHRILVLEPGGARRTLGRRGSRNGEFNFPVAVAFSEGVLWVGDTLNFRVQRLDFASGKYLGGFGGLGDSAGEMPRLKGLAVDGHGRLWVTDAHLDEVAVYGADGTFLLHVGRSGAEAGELSFPAGIAADAQGRIAVADSLNRRVQIFRLTMPEEGRDAR